MYCLECYNENPEGSLFCESCGCPFELTAKKEEKKLLKDRYKIISSLSSGGVGGVSLGYDVRLNRACAIKGIYKKGLQDLSPEERESIVKPFKREAELLANLRHPNLPCVTDYFIENDICYLVMDYIEGKDLEIILEEAGGKGLPEKQVIEWTIQICRVLEYLHEQTPPVIHGDLKLANLIIKDSDGWIMLVDFGTASLETLGGDEEQPIGTDGYAPPEQYIGAQEIRSDIYSLGATIYELLTTSLPEEAFNFPPLREITPEISADTERIIMKCLAYDVEGRFPNATILKQKLLAAYKKNFGMTKSRYRTGNLMIKDRKICETDLEIEQEYIKVLIVDDDIDMCNSFKEIAKFFKGIHIIGTVYNGKEALNKILGEDEKPDVVLMDIRMPVMNGIETTMKIREILPSAKIVILSAYLEEEEFMACFNAGATGYILKGDTSWEDLEKAIKKAFEGGTPISPDASTLLVKALTSQKISLGKPAASSKENKELYKDTEEDTKLCPSCNRLNRVKAKYCKECGANLDNLQTDEEIESDYEEEIIEEIIFVEEGEEGDLVEEEVVEEIFVEEDEEEETTSSQETIKEIEKETAPEKEVQKQTIPVAEVVEEKKIKIGSTDIEKEKQEEKNVAPASEEVVKQEEDKLAKAEELKQFARKYIIEEDWQTALIYLTQALPFTPRDPILNYELANIYYSSGKFDDSLKHYKIALQETPNMIEAYLGIGQIYLEKNDLQEAITYFKKALEINPKFSDAHLKLGYLKYKQDKLVDASNHFAYVIELEGDSLEAYIGLGNVYQVEEDFDSALQYYEAALKMDEYCVEAYSNLGRIYTKQGHLKKALQNVRKAISIEPVFIELYDELIEKIRTDKKEKSYHENELRPLLIDKVKSSENISLLSKIINTCISKENELKTIKDGETICSNCTAINRNNEISCLHCGIEFISQEELAQGIVNEVIQIILEEEEEHFFSKKTVKIAELMRTAKSMTSGLAIIKQLTDKKDDEMEDEVYTICPNCETLNRFDAKYCRMCGVQFDFEGEEEIINEEISEEEFTEKFQIKDGDKIIKSETPEEMKSTTEEAEEDIEEEMESVDSSKESLNKQKEKNNKTNGKKKKKKKKKKKR